MRSAVVCRMNSRSRALKRSLRATRILPPASTLNFHLLYVHRLNILRSPHDTFTSNMAEDSVKLRKRLTALTSTLDELEKELAPLLAQSLPETTMNLDPIQQAKLQVLLPYLTYDLSFSLSPFTHCDLVSDDRQSS